MVIRLSRSPPGNVSISPNSATLALKAGSPSVVFTAEDHNAPITLVEAKAFLKVETNDDDLLITGLINSAAEYAEQYTGIVCYAREQTFQFDAFTGRFELPRRPIRGISSINYIDSDGTAESLYDFTLRETYGFTTVSISGVWPSISTVYPGIDIVAEVGYRENDDVPSGIRTFALLYVNWLYTNRDGGEVPKSILAQLAPYMRGLV